MLRHKNTHPKNQKQTPKQVELKPEDKKSETTTDLFENVIAGNLQAIQTALKNGADVDKFNEVGWLPLHLSAYHGHTDIAQYLLQQTKHFDSPINSTLLKQKIDQLQHEIAQLDKNYQAEQQQHQRDFDKEAMPLKTIIQEGSQMISVPIGSQNAYGYNQGYGHTLWINGQQFTQQCKFDTSTYQNQLNVLQQKFNVAKQQHTQTYTTQKQKLQKELDFLKGRGEQTALHLAVIKGNVPLVKCLIKYGANVNSNDEQGMTPLHYAAQTGNEALAICLVKHGANPKIVNAEKQTALDKCNWNMKSTITHTRQQFKQQQRIMKLSAQNGQLEQALQQQTKELEALKEQLQEIKEHYQWLAIEYNEQQGILQSLQKNTEIAPAIISKKTDLNKDATKIQAAFRGFILRKQQPLGKLAAERQQHVKENAPYLISQFMKEEKYEQASKLMQAIKDGKYHEAMQIMRNIPEREFHLESGLKVKY